MTQQAFTVQQQQLRALTTEKIVDEALKANREKPIDLFLSYFYNAHFDPAGFSRLRDAGIPTINFYCNSIYQFDLVSEVARHVDFSWHSEKAAADSYKKIGGNPVWVQLGADADLYHPVEQGNRESKACFVGQRYCDRDRWLAALVRDGIPVDIFGNGWSPNKSSLPPSALRACGNEPGSFGAYAEVFSSNLKSGFVSGMARSVRQAIYAINSRRLTNFLMPHVKGHASDIAEVFGRYELILNFSNVWADGRPGSERIAHVRLRDFEAPMARAAYLTGHTSEITEFFDVGTEIDTYTSSEELVDKARFYLRSPSSAERLRERGYRRARRDHTWDERFKMLFTKTGISTRT